jgi:hypothetical protein
MSLEKATNGNAYHGSKLNGHSLDESQPAFPTYHRKFANPAPLGLSAFAATTFLLSLINVQTRGVEVPNLVVSMAYGYGGLVQLLAGMWEFAAGNTFGATAFSSYGGFWISFGLIFTPGSGILDGYAAAEGQLENVLGLYLFTWFIFTFIMLVAAHRSSLGLVLLFFFLDLTFLLLAVGFLMPTHTVITKAGGSFGLITAAIAWYVAAAGLLTPDTSFFTLPVGELKRAD